MEGTERLCAPEPHRALLGISTDYLIQKHIDDVYPDKI